MRLDAHQHFWRFDPVRDAWITPQMQVIRRDFMPDDLAPILQNHKLDGCVAVQADQSEAETLFLLEQARQYDFIKAVVGWIDLRAEDLAERLDRFAGYQALKGFRHILQGERPEFMLQPAFLRGLATLAQRGYTYDILVFPRHLRAVRQLLDRCEGQPFIVDHLAKPYIKKGLFKQWAADLRNLSRHPNVYAKVSGLVTEADWQRWTPEQLEPYLDIAFECFGERLCYGSDWPVCLLAGSYEQNFEAIAGYVGRHLSPNHAALFWGGAAQKFYRL